MVDTFAPTGYRNACCMLQAVFDIKSTQLSKATFFIGKNDDETKKLHHSPLDRTNELNMRAATVFDGKRAHEVEQFFRERFSIDSLTLSKPGRKKKERRR